MLGFATISSVERLNWITVQITKGTIVMLALYCISCSDVSTSKDAAKDIEVNATLEAVSGSTAIQSMQPQVVQPIYVPVYHSMQTQPYANPNYAYDEPVSTRPQDNPWAIPNRRYGPAGGYQYYSEMGAQPYYSAESGGYAQYRPLEQERDAPGRNDRNQNVQANPGYPSPPTSYAPRNATGYSAGYGYPAPMVYPSWQGMPYGAWLENR